MPGRRVLAALLSAVLGPAVVAAPAAAAPRPGDGAGLAARHSPRAPVTDENFYFVMADRFANGDRGNDLGGLPADRLVSGFDPTHKGFYHGGDLKGLRERIDYIRGLGTTSIWLTPSFKNKAVQLEDGPSAGYHGYWITDFTQIDPHLGSNADLRALIDAAHARGMKVYFDIITNHTADVIGYAEGARQRYVSKDVRPYRTAAGVPFDDRDHAARRGFPALDPRVSFPYTPVLEPGEENLKVPGWLNDVTLYHNRGDTTFVGEDSLYGDFFGLDDLFTEHPRVLDGMVEIYQGWIRDFGVDGFRIDTMKHVNDEFWQKFGPRLLRFAHAHGKREFFMFGEVFDTTKAFTSHFTTTDRMQAVLDFPFQAAARDFASRGRPTGQLEGFFTADDWYTDADSNVYQLPTFLGNHDMGRIGGFIQADNPGAGDAEWLARDRLAHELMYFSRGNPVVYYGDEQGFTGPGGDQDARQSLFASQVGSYLDDDLLGTDATHAGDNFATGHPLYRAIGRLAGVTRAHPALRDGAHQHRYAGTGAGVYAFTRLDRGQQHEYVVALNNSEQPQSAPVPTYLPRAGFSRVYGDAPARLTSGADRRLTVTVPPLSTVVYRSDTRRRVARADAPPGGGRRFVVLRGHLLRPGRQRRMDADRHRRHRPVPGVPRRQRVAAGHTGAVPRRRAGQRRAHRGERLRARQRAGTGADHRVAARGQRRAGDRRGARHRRPGPRHPPGQLPTAGGRPPMDRHRRRLVVTGVHRLRRPGAAEPGRRRGGGVPGDPGWARDPGDQRGAPGPGRRPAGDHGPAALPAAGRRLRAVGAAPVG